MVISTLVRTDIEAFEKVYQDEHVTHAVEKLGGRPMFVATKVLDLLRGYHLFNRVAEIHFPSMEALEACAAFAGAKETLAHAVSISTGGRPIFFGR